MNELLKSDGRREIEQFDPERYRLKMAALDYSIEHAQRIRDWPKLEEAVDVKIEEQRRFVAWWKGNIRSQGEVRKKENRDPGFLSVCEAERFTGMKQQRVSDLGRRLQEPDKYRERLLGAGYLAALLEAVDARGTKGTGENEWFTPPEYIGRARAVLGGIDLDPATHIEAQKIIGARQYFTKADDGLQHEWHGRVWLNPPYAQPLIAHFVSKMCVERTAGRVSAAIMLTHNYTDTAWFHEAAGITDAICFTRGRIKFYEPDGAIAAPTQGQAFFYFGNKIECFAREFENVGFVLRRWTS